MTTKVCCLLRARSVKYCWRSDASKISRFKYICGGEDGRRVVGSGGAGASRDAFPRSDSDVVWPAALAASVSRLVFGGGAPLTTWSSFESDMVGVALNCRYGDSSCIIGGERCVILFIATE